MQSQTILERPHLESPKPHQATSSLIAALWVADLPSWALKRVEPSLRETPVVVLEGLRVVGRCSQAKKAGIQIGDALHRARSLCPEAAMAQLEPSAIKAAWDTALETMYQVTPWIESFQTGLAFLTGITALEAEALATELQVRIGMSATRNSSLLAALASREHQIRLVIDEADFLARVPVYLLRGAGVSSEVIERLKLFGLQTLGDILLRTTPHQLELQFKKEAKRLLELVGNPVSLPIPVFMPNKSIKTEYVFEPPALEPHEYEPALEHLLKKAVLQLESFWVGAVTVHLTTALGDSAARQVLKTYTADAKSLLLAALRCLQNAHTGLEIERLTLVFSDLLKPIPKQDNLFEIIERPNVREAIQVVHQHFPDRIGRLEIHRPNAPLREQQFRFAALDGQTPRVKKATGKRKKS